MKRFISWLIILSLLFTTHTTVVFAKENTDVTIGYINTMNAKNGSKSLYQGICKNDTIYMLPNDIAAIGEYDYEILYLERKKSESIIESSTILSKLYSKLNLDKLFKKDNFEYLVFSRKDTTTDYITQIYYHDGYAQTMNKSFEIDTLDYNGKTYLNLEKMLYLMHAQWCVEDSTLCYYPLDYNIFDFIGEKFVYMRDSSVQHNSLLYEGENKWGHSTRIVLSHILNDVDMRIFIPFFGDDLIEQEFYEEAILQLATTDDSFIDDVGSEQISEYLEDSPYHKIETNLNLLEGTFNTIEEIEDKIASSKTSKFSQWNDFSTIKSAELGAIEKKVENFGDVLSVANILIDFNEINTRSKNWSDDFVNGLNVLFNMNKAMHGDCGKRIKKVADDLLEEFEKPTETAAEAAMLDVYGLVIDKLLNETIIGHIESIITLTNVIIKSNPDYAKKIENADLMNTVHALINVENVFLNEFVDAYHDYLHYLGIEDGTSSLRLWELMQNSINENPKKEIEAYAISDMRNALEMFLKTSLRNKTYVYHFSCFNGESNWTKTNEAKSLKDDIYKTYALLSELILTRDYDRLIYLDETYGSIYSKEYGLVREKIDVSLLKTTDDVCVDNFEDMLNTANICFNGNEDFSKLLVSDLIRNYIALDGMPCGLYEYFSGETIHYTGYSMGHDGGYNDPQKRFFTSYELEADEVNWILENVFERTTEDIILGDNIYYHGDKVYILAELGGGPTLIFDVKEYNLIEDNKYEILVRSEWNTGVPNDFYANFKFVASLEQDDQRGFYWKLYSCEKIDEIIQQSDSDIAWKNAYIDFINSSDKGSESIFGFESYDYYLINIDDDGIPELHIEYLSVAGGADVCSYQNGEIIVQHIYDFGLSYMEKQGIFLDSGGRMDHYHDKVYSLKNGSISLVSSGEWIVTWSPEGNGEHSEEYLWDGKSISKEEYEEKLNSYFDESQAISPYEENQVYDCYEIISAINDYPVG